MPLVYLAILGTVEVMAVTVKGLGKFIQMGSGRENPMPVRARWAALEAVQSPCPMASGILVYQW